MLLVEEYFTVVGWEEEFQKKKRLVELLSEHMGSVNSEEAEDKLVQKIEKIEPHLAWRIKRVPQTCRLQAIIYLYRGASIKEPHSLGEYLGFYGHLQRLRGFFPSLVPEPEKLFSSLEMLKACLSLVLFEDYDRKLESEISRLTRKPFKLPKAKSPIRLTASRLNYEVYVSAYGKKVSLFTTTSMEKAFKLFTLYAVYQMAMNIKSFLSGEVFKEWKESFLESISIHQAPEGKMTRSHH